MERIKRTYFQGIINVVRFNWHTYLVAIIFILLLLLTLPLVTSVFRILINVVILVTFLSILSSLIISFYIYDYSGLYKLEWLNFLSVSANSQMININAGFDETSYLLKEKFKTSNLKVYDFYDPLKHTEISIKRAREIYSVYPGTKNIQTKSVPLSTGSTDFIFAFLAVHEIRNQQEQILFFKELKRCLALQGRIIIIEHLRDLPNFIAYNIGFFHFFSKKEWKDTFSAAGLDLAMEIKITPFLSAFILHKNGTSS